MLLETLENIIRKNKETRKDFLRNLLKEYLELAALGFIYNSEYSFLNFKGGSCLRLCFNLPRLSEDLDFDYNKKFKTGEFFESLISYFKKEQNFSQIESKIGTERLYLKFPILRKLGIAKRNESDKLYLKIELAPSKQCPFKTETEPILKEGFSFLVKRYSLEDLMAGKICAVLGRVWFRGKRNEIKVKGRDFFDLYWFMKQKIIPNYNCIFYKGKQISSQKVWEIIKDRIEQVNSREIEYDLRALIKEQRFVKEFSIRFKDLFKKELAFYNKQ